MYLNCYEHGPWIRNYVPDFKHTELRFINTNFVQIFIPG
jgi:hypothetical protein